MTTTTSDREDFHVWKCGVSSVERNGDRVAVDDFGRSLACTTDVQRNNHRFPHPVTKAPTAPQRARGLLSATKVEEPAPYNLDVKGA